jgi:hypothetical protein
MSSRLNDVLGINIEPTAEGERQRITKDKLEAYGIAGKEYDAVPVAEVSVVKVAKATQLASMEFFREHNAKSAIRGVEFPNKSKAFMIDCIAVDVDVNLGANDQANLKALQFFLKNSLLKTKLNRADHLSIPLSECVPFAIEFDGENYTKRIVRNGFMIEGDGVKIPMNGEFEALIIPAQGYTTHATVVNPAETGSENEFRIILKGYSIQTPVV